MEQQIKYDTLLSSANKPCGTEHIVLPHDSTRWSSTWRAKQPLKLQPFSRFTVPRSPSGCAVGSSTEWTACWRDIDPVASLPCPIVRSKNLPTSWTAGLWRMDSPRAYGQVLWSQELLKKNILLLTIRLMSPASFMILDSPSSGLRRRWPRLIRISSPAGFAINIPTLKKSQERRGGHPLRRRGKFPARPHALPYMGASRFSATNTNYRAAKHTQDFRYGRVVSRQISLSLPGRLQCRNIHRVSRTNIAALFSTKSISDSGQCIVSQRRRRMGMVFRTPQIHHGLQPSPLFSRTQCAGEGLASYTHVRHAQPILCNAGRTSFSIDFNIPEYSKKSVSDHWLSASLSVINHDYYYVALIMQCYIAASMFFKFNKTIYYKYNASDPEYLSSKTPNHLLIWHLVEKSCLEGFDTIDLGRTAKDNPGLTRYKNMWGAKPYELPYYYYPVAKGASSQDESGISYKIMTGIWKHLPDIIVDRLGPVLMKQLA